MLVSCGGLVAREEASPSLDHVPVGADARAVDLTAQPSESRDASASGPIVKIAASETAMCGVQRDGRVVCWGINAVLLATGLEDGGYGFGPAIVPGLSAVRDVALAKPSRYGYAGEPFVCAVKSDGMVLCWGANYASQLGRGEDASGPDIVDQPPDFVPHAVVGLPPVTDLSLGSAFGCAVPEDGGVRCWGANGSFALGRPKLTPVTLPWIPRDSVAKPMVTEPPAVEKLSLGQDYSCALGSNHRVVCWGGMFGLGSASDSLTADAATPREVVGLGDVVELAAGAQHACARTAAGVVLSWGLDWFGALGREITDAGYYVHDAPVPPLSARVDMSPAPVPLPAGRSATAIASGADVSCAILDDDSVWCWGWNDRGQAGGSASDTPLPPHPLSGIPGKPVQIAIGKVGTCALLEDGRVACWGTFGYVDGGPVYATPTIVPL